MNLFRRHLISTLFLAFYFTWLGYVYYWFASGKAAYPNSCGAANGGLVMLSIVMLLVYSITLIIKIVTDNQRKDFAAFLGLVYLPVILILLF